MRSFALLFPVGIKFELNLPHRKLLASLLASLYEFLLAIVWLADLENHVNSAMPLIWTETTGHGYDQFRSYEDRGAACIRLEK